jgi:uncharacterized protein YndB with AHSA1/START domain
MEPLTLRFTVACAPAHAFAVWAERTALWWPPGHSVSGAPEHVGFEPRVGGRIFERGADGAEHEWGEVLDWEPPRRLRYLWHLRFDRADATEVEITFDDAPQGTAVTIVHTGWERLGAAGPDRRERNRRGWAGLLPHYVAACAQSS